MRNAGSVPSRLSAAFPRNGDRSVARGSVLVAVLWSLVILSIVAAGMIQASLIDLRLAKQHADAEQAYYLALAGIETAKARIRDERDRDALSGSRSFGSRIEDDPLGFRDQRLGRGTWSVLRSPSRGGGSERFAYGVTDESSRLDINSVAAEELARIPDLPPGLAAAIVDWRDGDNEPSQDGAEGEHYATLEDPYEMRNGPFETLRELLRVRGMTAEDLLGEDRNADGLLDFEENDRAESTPPDNGDGALEAGWSEWLSLHSASRNVNARGEQRANLQTADVDRLLQIRGMSQPIAQAIVQHRQSGSFESIAQLLDVRAAAPQQQGQQQQQQPSAPAQPSSAPQGAQQGGPPQQAAPAAVDAGSRVLVTDTSQLSVNSPAPQQSQGPGGEKLISAQLLQQFADEVTASPDDVLHGQININSAPEKVLACINGLDPDLARAIVQYRSEHRGFRNVAELLSVPGMSEDKFKQVANRLTVRGDAFRILAEGVVPATGARKRIEVVVQLTRYGFDTVSYREAFQ